MNLTWFDAAALSFLCWGGVEGYLKGITLSIFNVLGWVAALVVAFYARTPLSFFVNQEYNLVPLLTRVISRRVDLPLQVGGFISPEGGSRGEFLYPWLAEALVNLLSFLAVFFLIIALLKILEGILSLKENRSIFLKNLISSLLGVLKNFLVIFALLYLILPLWEVVDSLPLEDIANSLTVTAINGLLKIIFPGY